MQAGVLPPFLVTCEQLHRSARVRVEGTVNGERFAVERMTRRKQLARLTFELGGADCTGADARLTQASAPAVLPLCTFRHSLIICLSE